MHRVSLAAKWILSLTLCSMLASVIWTMPPKGHQRTCWTDENGPTEHSVYCALVVPKRSPLGFPAKESTLLALRDSVGTDSGAFDKLRGHAWDIFVGLNQPSDPRNPKSSAVWETWYTRCETFRHATGDVCPFRSGKAAGTANIIQELRVPTQFLDTSLTVDSETLLNTVLAPGRSTLAGVMFNRPAQHHISINDLDDPPTMIRLVQTGALSVPEFPRDAVALKTVWHHIAKGNHDSRTLHVWDPPSPEVSGCPYPSPDGDGPRPLMLDERLHGKCSTNGDYPGWMHSVTIDMEGGARSRKCNLPPTTSGPLAGHVSIGCFHFLKVDKSVAKQLDPKHTQGILPGDYFVLTAMHIATREIKNWTWSTFWWHDHPAQCGSPRSIKGSCEFAAGRPESVSGPWRNYLMDTTLGETMPKGITNHNHATFNPLLEAHFENGVFSNCMTCHEMAAYPEENTPIVPHGHPAIPEGYQMALCDPEKQPDQGAIQSFVSDPKTFNNEIRVSFLWSFGNVKFLPVLPVSANNQHSFVSFSCRSER
jgi:hypothetical protein